MRATAESIVFEAFGVTASVQSNAPLSLDEVLPPGWRAGDPRRVSARFSLDGDVVRWDGHVVMPHAAGRGPDRLESVIRGHVALNAPEHVFIHAGVVVHRGVAIVLPGRSFSGKTTLVAALLRAGATYASDEFAAIDADGLVHPYPRPLSMREPGATDQVAVAPAELGAEVASGPARAGVVAITSHRSGAVWTPERRDRAAGAMALLANAVAARSRPAQVMTAARRAVTGALVVQGVRGEADDAAAALVSQNLAAAA